MLNPSHLLKSQGWLGHGHALHPSGKGARTPILTARKNNTLGVGKKRVDVHADQWWARAFDAGLKGLEVGGDGVQAAAGTGAEGVKGIAKAAKKETEGMDGDLGKKEDRMVVELRAMARGGGGKWLGLYDGFVRGEGLSGTLEDGERGRDGDGVEVVEGVEESTGEKTKEKKKKKRKRDRGETGDADDAEATPRKKRTSKKHRVKHAIEDVGSHEEPIKKEKKHKKSRHLKEHASDG